MTDRMSTSSETLAARGDAYWRCREFRQARECYAAALDLDASDETLWLRYGHAAQVCGQATEAHRAFTQAIRLFPEGSAGYFCRAEAALELGQGSAGDDFDRAIALARDDPAPLAGRGRWHMRQGDVHAAMRDFTAALQRANAFNEPIPQLYLERAEAFVILGWIKEAIEDLSAALRLDPLDASAYRRRAELRQQIGQLRAAQRDVDIAQQLES